MSDPTTTAVAEDSAVKKRKHLTPKKEAEAIALWQAGEITLEALEEKYGLSKRTFIRLFAEKGVKKGEKKSEVTEVVKKAVEGAISASAAEEAALVLSRIKETKEDHFRMNKAIVGLIWTEIVEARKLGHPMAAILPNIKALKEALHAISLGREEKYVALGIRNGENADGDDLPSLLIAEVTADQIQEMQRETAIEGDDMLTAIEDVTLTGETVEVSEIGVDDDDISAPT